MDSTTIQALSGVIPIALGLFPLIFILQLFSYDRLSPLTLFFLIVFGIGMTFFVVPQFSEVLRQGLLQGEAPVSGGYGVTAYGVQLQKIPDAANNSTADWTDENASSVLDEDWWYLGDDSWN